MQFPSNKGTSQACICHHGCFAAAAASLFCPSESSKPCQLEFAVSTASILYNNTKFTNHESLPSLRESFANFIRAYPGYLQTKQADEIRAKEYQILSFSQHVYLNHIGHCLFSDSQLQCQNDYAHSSQSLVSTALQSSFFDLSCKSLNLGAEMLLYASQEPELQSKIRKRIMGFMNLSESDYSLVFTSNPSSAFELVAGSYPFQSNPSLLTVYDHENEAVESMIEHSEKRGAKVKSAEFMWPNLQIRSGKLRKKLTRSKKRGLFVFPLQSRVTGAWYSYSWMSLALENGWHILLDACGLGAKTMETLGLSLFKPDFLICSFFEVFGESPSGFGCLFIKKSSYGPKLENLNLATAEPDTRVKEPPGSTSGSTSILLKNQKSLELSESFSEIVELEPLSLLDQLRITTSSSNEDQRLEFRGLDHADSLGLILISQRVRYLTNWLINALETLQHPSSLDENGIPLVTIYGPGTNFNHGPSIAFNLSDWQGQKIDPLLVRSLAERHNIFLGCGVLKNICWGSIDHRTRTKDGFLGHEVPVVTVFLGFLTDFEDVHKVWVFVSRFLDADFLRKRGAGTNQRTP